MSGARMIGFVDNTGLAVLEFFAFFRDVCVLVYGALKSPFVVRTRGARVVWEILLAQVRFTGAQGAALAGLAAMAIGTLILIEAVTFIPNAEIVPHIVALITVKDVVPLLTALVIIGRSGTAISVELANMKLNREIDALVSMGLPLEHVVVLPRLVGAVLSFVGMVVVGQAAGLVGGFLLARLVIHMPFTLPVLIQNVKLGDMAVAFMKCVLLGGAISAICIREGFSVTVSAREVPQAATRAVVRSMTFCLVLNSFLSIYT
jgi:phospholipid/cholesterol/gamma-HCH transport system permease protein